MTGITNSACPVYLTYEQALRLSQMIWAEPHRDLPPDFVIGTLVDEAIRKFEERDVADAG